MVMLDGGVNGFGCGLEVMENFPLLLRRNFVLNAANAAGKR